MILSFRRRIEGGFPLLRCPASLLTTSFQRGEGIAPPMTAKESFADSCCQGRRGFASQNRKSFPPAPILHVTLGFPVSPTAFSI